MGAESRIETAVRLEAIAAGWRVRKLTFIGTNGAPDRIFGKQRRTIVIEFKAPGEEPTLQQHRRMNELREEFGWEVHWVDNVNHARRLLGLREQ